MTENNEGMIGIDELLEKEGLPPMSEQEAKPKKESLVKKIKKILKK